MSVIRELDISRSVTYVLPSPLLKRENMCDCHYYYYYYLLLQVFFLAWYFYS
jgi:hypothetical protein